MTLTIEKAKAAIAELTALNESIPRTHVIDCAGVNAEHLQAAIDVLTRVRDENRAFNILTWFSRPSDVATDQTEEQQHACGTSACALGWIATTEAWRAAGGKAFDRIGGYGATPMLVVNGKPEAGTVAARHWLNIPHKAAEMLFLPRGTRNRVNFTYPNRFGGDDVSDWIYVYYTPYKDCDDYSQISVDEVIKALAEIRDTSKLTGRQDFKGSDIASAVFHMQRYVEDREAQ